MFTIDKTIPVSIALFQFKLRFNLTPKETLGAVLFC